MSLKNSIYKKLIEKIYNIIFLKYNDIINW